MSLRQQQYLPKNNPEIFSHLGLNTPDHRGVLRLIGEWLNETTSYDQKNWPKLKKLIEKNRLGRKRFV